MTMLKVVCRCRNCGTTYDSRRSRADFTGFCTAACQHEKAQALGFKKRKGWQPVDNTEFQILKRNNMVGDVPVAVIDLKEDWLWKLKRELEKQLTRSSEGPTTKADLKIIVDELKDRGVA